MYIAQAVTWEPDGRYFVPVWFLDDRPMECNTGDYVVTMIGG